MYDGSLAGALTRPSQRPYCCPSPHSMPAVLPLGSPVIVRIPLPTPTAFGVRRPFPACPGPSYTPHAGPRRVPSNSSTRVGSPQFCRAAALVACPAETRALGGHGTATERPAICAFSTATPSAASNRLTGARRSADPTQSGRGGWAATAGAAPAISARTSSPPTAATRRAVYLVSRPMGLPLTSLDKRRER